MGDVSDRLNLIEVPRADRNSGEKIQSHYVALLSRSPVSVSMFVTLLALAVSAPAESQNREQMPLA